MMKRILLVALGLITANCDAKIESIPLKLLNKTDEPFKLIIATAEDAPRFVGTNYRLPAKGKQEIEVPGNNFQMLLYRAQPTKPKGDIYSIKTTGKKVAAIRITSANGAPTLEPQTNKLVKIPGNVEADDIKWIKTGNLIDLIADSEAEDHALINYLRDRDVPGLNEFFSQSKKANVNPKHRNDALIFAADQGKPTLIEKIINAGADVNAKDAAGKTALVHAMRNGSEVGTEIIKMLIKHGANVNALDNDGYTPLMNAAQTDTQWAVELLLANHADASLENEKDHNLTAADYTRSEKIRELLAPIK